MTRLFEPQLLLFLITALGLGNLWRKRQESRRRLLCATAPFVALALMSTPAVSCLALGSLEWPFPPLETRPDDIEAIVVLSGNVRLPDTPSTGYALGTSTLNRCIKAARLYHQGRPCPVIVAGGKLTGDATKPAVADLMKSFLVQLGVKPDDVILEGQSRNTHENVREVRKLLEERHLHKIIVVTDASHLWRALSSFQRQGVESVVPAGCRYRADPPDSVFDFLPDVNGARNVQDACHEWLGIVWYWLRGL